MTPIPGDMMNVYAIFTPNGKFLSSETLGHDHADALVRFAENESTLPASHSLAKVGEDYIVVNKVRPLAGNVGSGGVRLLRLERVKQPQFKAVPR